MKKITCVIPARLESTRFPHKLLKSIAGKPILHWVWDAAKKIEVFDNVVIAVDSEKTADLVKSFGGKFLMTSPECKSGTARLIEVMQRKEFNADIWVNWQGDEPFVTKGHIEKLLSTSHDDSVDVWTLKKRIIKENDINCPNIAKVVCDSNDCALYFSRSTIPFYRDEDGCERVYYKHLGIYAYTTNALEKISLISKSELEDAEKLEQLSFLQHGLKIKVLETDTEVLGIDRPCDLEKAEEFVKKNGLGVNL